MNEKIKILNELKEFCVSVDDLAEVNMLNYYAKMIKHLTDSIIYAIDLKIVDLKQKKEKEEKEVNYKRV